MYDSQFDAEYENGWCLQCGDGYHEGCAAAEDGLSRLESEFHDDCPLEDLPDNPDARYDRLMEHHYQNRHHDCRSCTTCGCPGSLCDCLALGAAKDD